MQITLASASPRRIELIKKIPNLEVSVMSADIDERTDKTDAAEAVTDLAEQKAKAVRDKGVKGLILAADTMVDVNGKRMGKPKSASEARQMFGLLCGTTHRVLTGVCLTNGDKTVSAFAETKVTFAPYDERIVEHYISTGKPFDKAGGYGIQDTELKDMVIGIDGEYDNVLGLPVRLVGRLIEENYL